MLRKVTFILGAGASIPYLQNDDKKLTTDFLTEAILKETNWIDIIKKHSILQEKRYDNKYKLDKIYFEDVYPVIQSLEYILKHNLRFGNINFEYLIHLIDKISLVNSAHHHGEYDDIDILILDCYIDRNARNIKTSKSDFDG